MIEVRSALKNDAALISGLGAKSFFEAFGEHNKQEDLEIYIAEKFSMEQIKEEISDPLASFFVAYYESEPAGYAKLIKSNLPEQIKDKNAVEMQRMYVLEKFYGMKIGRELMLYTLEFAFTKGYDSMWLGVWQKNERAIEFYKKFGFEVFGTREFKIGCNTQDDYMMIKHL